MPNGGQVNVLRYRLYQLALLAVPPALTRELRTGKSLEPLSGIVNRGLVLGYRLFVL